MRSQKGCRKDAEIPTPRAPLRKVSVNVVRTLPRKARGFDATEEEARAEVEGALSPTLLRGWKVESVEPKESA